MEFHEYAKVWAVQGFGRFESQKFRDFKEAKAYARLVVAEKSYRRCDPVTEIHRERYGSPEAVTVVRL